MDKTPLTFNGINRGAQALLSDGSVWRVGLNHVATAGRWEKGDSVRIADSDSFTHPQLLINEDRDEQVPVVKSARL